MEKCNCDNLEEAFLKLSITQEDHDDIKEVSIMNNQHLPKLLILIVINFTFIQVVPEPKKTSHPKLLEFEEDNRIFSRKKFGAVMYKNWTLFKREYT